MDNPINISNLAAEPIRHHGLPGAFINRVKAFKAILGDVDTAPLEQTLDAFSRDANPTNELVIWERIANIFQQFISHNAVSDPAVKKEVLAVLLGASMGTDNWNTIKQLSRDQINHLVITYRGLSNMSS